MMNHFFGGDYPFIQTGEVKSANFYLNSFSETYNEKGLAQSKLWEKGTLLITIAANIAETAILDIEACFPDSIIGFIPYENKSDVKFVKYYLDYIKRKLQVISQGTTQDNMSVEKLTSMPLFVPDYNIQVKIGKLLSNYDDLIENNSKRIKLLEQTAEELYKEWFVRLRFPNYQNTKIEDGIPEGWEEKRFSEIIKLQSGYAFKSENFEKTSSQRLVIRMGNFKITGGLKFDSNVKYLNDNVKVKEQYYLSPGDMLIVLSDVTRNGSIIGNVGIVPNNNIKYVLNQRVSKLVFDDFLKYYLYAYFNSFIFKNYCLAHADSATVLNLSNQDLYKHKMVIPSKKVIEEFSNIIKFIYEQIDYFIIKNQTLKETRDLLLPRLLSGKLDIEKLDIN